MTLESDLNESENDIGKEQNAEKIKSPKRGKINPPFKTKQRKIVIFGGRQCIGLAAMLNKLRQSNKMNEQYLITSFVKPDASTEEILTTCRLYELDESDKVILCVGQHDTNPTKLLIELGILH